MSVVETTKAGKLALAAQLYWPGGKLTSAVSEVEITHVRERRCAEASTIEDGERSFVWAAAGSFTRTNSVNQPLGSVTVEREVTTPDVVDETSKREIVHGHKLNNANVQPSLLLHPSGTHRVYHPSPI